MVFNTTSPTDHMFDSLPSSFVEHPLSDECKFSSIQSTKQKIVLNSQETNEYQRLESPINQLTEEPKISKTDEESIISLWQNSGKEKKIFFSNFKYNFIFDS